MSSSVSLMSCSCRVCESFSHVPALACPSDPVDPVRRSENSSHDLATGGQQRGREGGRDALDAQLLTNDLADATHWLRVVNDDHLPRVIDENDLQGTENLLEFNRVLE